MLQASSPQAMTSMGGTANDQIEKIFHQEVIGNQNDLIIVGFTESSNYPLAEYHSASSLIPYNDNSFPIPSGGSPPFTHPYITNLHNAAPWNRIAYNFSNVAIELMQPFVSIYPNPSDGIINIDLKLENSTIISIFDNLGRKVYFMDSHSEGHIELDLSNFINGIYLVEVKTKDGIEREKILLSK